MMATPDSPIALADMIVRTPEIFAGKPRIAGSRIRVEDIYVWHELQGQTVDEIVASFPQLTHSQVHMALAYYFSHIDEIREEMAKAERDVEELKARLGPGPLEDKRFQNGSLKANSPAKNLDLTLTSN